MWPFVSERIEIFAAITGKFDALHFLEAFRKEEKQLWVVYSDNLEAVVITTINQFPNRRVLRIDGCIGDNRKKWMNLLVGIEGYAKNMGCDAVEFTGRTGWARDMKDYRKTAIMLEKRL